MDAIEAQKSIMQLLIKRLKACSLESAAFRAVFFNFSDNAQLEAWKMFRYYHEADPIRQKVETQFRDLDSLIQRVDAGLQEEEFRRLLERYDPSGPPN